MGCFELCAFTNGPMLGPTEVSGARLCDGGLLLTNTVCFVRVPFSFFTHEHACHSGQFRVAGAVFQVSAGVTSPVRSKPSVVEAP